MAKNWTHVRVQVKTLEALRVLADQVIEQNAEHGKYVEADINLEVRNPKAKVLSFDALIRLLMGEVTRKRQAAWEQRERERARRKAAE